MHEAEAIQHEACRIIDRLLYVRAINAVKYLLGRQGLSCGNCRLPFSPITEQEKHLLDDIGAVSYTHLGIMDGVADTPEKIDRYIKTIYNKANDMNRLINELTYYSGIDKMCIRDSHIPWRGCEDTEGEWRIRSLDPLEGIRAGETQLIGEEKEGNVVYTIPDSCLLYTSRCV